MFHRAIYKRCLSEVHRMPIRSHKIVIPHASASPQNYIYLWTIAFDFWEFGIFESKKKTCEISNHTNFTHCAKSRKRTSVIFNPKKLFFWDPYRPKNIQSNTKMLSPTDAPKRCRFYLGGTYAMVLHLYALRSGGCRIGVCSSEWLSEAGGGSDPPTHQDGCRGGWTQPTHHQWGSVCTRKGFT